MPMEDLLTRQAPHSQEAEQSVLGSMLIDSRCISDVVGVVRPEDFYLQANREIYETMYEMFSYSEVIDPVTVLDKMRARGVYNEESSTKYLMQLMEITPTAANVKRYAQIVHDKALLRSLSEAASGIVETVYEGVGSAQEILEAAEKRIYALRRGNTNESLEHIGTVLLKVFDRLKELSESGSDISGLSTGLRDLDKFINGLNRSDLVLLAARPGMGKTSMALNVALNVAKKNPQKTVAFFSLEMSKEQLVTRLISNESFVDNKKLVTGQLSMEEWSKIGIAATALSQTDIRVDDNPSLSVAEMNAKCRRLDNLCLVIIDYLQLMVSAGGRTYSGENRQQVVSDISRSLKIMAKELNVPVLCLSQLSRANESRQDKRPLLSDLRESGAIEQDADEVMFLYREDYYNKDTPEQNVAECIVAKNRHGETGTVKLQWLPGAAGRRCFPQARRSCVPSPAGRIPWQCSAACASWRRSFPSMCGRRTSTIACAGRSPTATRPLCARSARPRASSSSAARRKSPPAARRRRGSSAMPSSIPSRATPLPSLTRPRIISRRCCSICCAAAGCGASAASRRAAGAMYGRCWPFPMRRRGNICARGARAGARMRRTRRTAASATACATACCLCWRPRCRSCRCALRS